jgi:hypothetical protein
MTKRKRSGGWWGNIKNAVLGKELPSGEEVRRQYTNVDQIPTGYDNIEFDKPITYGSKTCRTVGELKDAEYKNFCDTYSYGA